MRNLLLVIVFIFIGSGLSAQNNEADYLELQKETLKVEKKALIADAMILTNEESEVFWPLYDEYNAKKFELKKEFYFLLKSYFESTEEQLTDKEATKIWKKKIQLNADLNKLEKKYFNKMINKLPPVKVVRYFQAENKVDALISAELASEIPLLGDLGQ
ncbi:MAG: hypothetical protein ABFR62_09605 [Bacteroidota bacterium]